MEVSVRNEEKRPKILGIVHEYEDFTDLTITCNMFHGFDQAIDKRSPLEVYEFNADSFQTQIPWFYSYVCVLYQH